MAHLYLLEDVGDYGPLNTLSFGQVKCKLIVEHWDEMRRVASSIRHGTVSASLRVPQAGRLSAAEPEQVPPLEHLAMSLRERHLLLVLDNVEQVLDAASHLGELLLACPGSMRR